MTAPKARGAPAKATLAGIVLLVAYVLIGVAGDAGRERNVRHDTLLWLANLPETTSGAAAVAGDTIALSPLDRGQESSASWDVSSYEIAHLLAGARACRARLFILDSNLLGTSAQARADILLDGSLVERVAFGQARRGFYAAAPGRLLPDVTPQLVDVVALDRRYGFVVPLPQRFCATQEWRLGVRARDVSWTITGVGVALDYEPAFVPLLRSRPATVAAGALLALVLLACLFTVLRRLASLGTSPLLAGGAVLLVAPLTYDQWDFPLWVRFAEAAACGGANPAHLWHGSPLWSFVPSLFGTLTLASYFVTGDGSRELTELSLKIGMGLAYCYAAYTIAMQAPRRLRRSIAVGALLVPGGLYEVAGGYREPFAAVLALVGFTLVQRRALVPATIALCAAASISETLLPLVLLPAAVCLLPGRPARLRIAPSAALAALGAALFCAEWLFLIPRDTATIALTYRFGTAHLGGGSWAGALAGLGALPAWLPAGAPMFGVTVFLLASAAPARRLLRVLRAGGSARSFEDVLAPFVGFVAAFFLAFRGIDSNAWYLFLVVTLYYFASADAASPFPLLLGSISGCAFYALVGLGDFANHALLWPFDRGLLGTLGVGRYAFNLMLSGFALCAIVHVSGGKERNLFSGRSGWFATLFVCAVATTAIRSYVLDCIVCGAFIALAVPSFAQRSSPTEAFQRRLLRPPLAAALGATLWAAMFAATHSGPASLAAAAAALMVARFGAGLCDLVLAAGAIVLLDVQTGFGWTSLAGWTALALTASYAAFSCLVVRERVSAPVPS